ncbi:putative reverse transcriptase domain-containing protein [Tanacetum coccineum]
MAPRRGTKKRTRTRTTLATATATTPMTNVANRVLIAQGVTDALTGRTIQRNTNLNDDGSQGSGSGITRPVRPTRECTYCDFLKCQPMNFKGTKGVVSLTQWFERMETVFHISNCIVENQVKFATCTLHGVALTWWNSHVKTVGHDAAYDMPWKTLMKMMTPETRGTTLVGLTLLGLVRRGSMVDLCQNVPNATTIIMVYVHQNATSAKRLATWPGITGVLEMPTLRQCPKLKNKNRGNQGGNGNASSKVYVVGNTGTNLDSNVVTGTFLLNTAMLLSYLILTPIGVFIDLMPVELGSFDIIIGMDWLAKYHAVIICDEKLVRIPFENETLIVCGDRSNPGSETRLNIISCTKTQKYMLKGCLVFFAQDKKEHEEHLKAILELLKKEEFKGIHVDPAKIESIKYWVSPKTPMEIRQFLGLAGYYRRFIKGFSKIAKSMTKLTQKGVMFDWGNKEEAAFQLIKKKLCSAPILALPKGSKDFVVCCDASHKGWVLY